MEQSVKVIGHHRPSEKAAIADATVCHASCGCGRDPFAEYGPPAGYHVKKRRG
jgi:hypothetical protein